MNDELRDMRYTRWGDRVTASRFYSRALEFGGTDGREAIYLVDAITAPLRVFNGSKTITINDTGYSWYQLALRDRFVWLHACFDAAGELVEVYFDVTAGNRFDDPEEPCFQDMYLDVVITPAGELRTLDRDELDAALESEAITRAEYDAAIAHGEALLRDIEQRRFDVIDFCVKHRKSLLAEAERQGWK